MTALSVCQTNGKWSRAEAAPGPVPPSLVLPDPAGPAPCPCPALNLTYNPNTEAGTTFHCTVGPDWSRLPARLPPTARCSLRCAGLAAAAVHCRAGVWTGQPLSSGLWCREDRGPVGLWLDLNTKTMNPDNTTEAGGAGDSNTSSIVDDQNSSNVEETVSVHTTTDETTLAPSSSVKNVTDVIVTSADMGKDLANSKSEGKTENASDIIIDGPNIIVTKPVKKDKRVEDLLKGDSTRGEWEDQEQHDFMYDYRKYKLLQE